MRCGSVAHHWGAHLPSPDGNSERLPLADEKDEPLSSGYARVDQIARQHGVVVGRDRDHHRRVLGALALVDGGRNRQARGCRVPRKG